MRKFILILLALILLTACSKNEIKSEQVLEKESNTVVQESTENLTTEESNETNKTPEYPQFPLNETGKTQVHVITNNRTYSYNSYLIVSSDNKKVMLDPADMPKISTIDIAPDIIASTHSHSDHFDSKFYQQYVDNCELVTGRMKDVDLENLKLTCIASSHSSDDIDAEYPGNIILLLETDGLRIAHMGDIGQTYLTDEQIELLGEIDIAFMQFENSYSKMSTSNMKGFNLIESLNPKIVIPTHFRDESFNLLGDKYGEIQIIDDVLTISKEELPDDTLNVIHIKNNYLYANK